MSYAQSVLQPGETIVTVGRLHWIIYRWAILSLVAGRAAGVVRVRHWPYQDGLIKITALMFAVLFVVTFIYAWFIRWITEFAVTNRRVISSRVFIARTPKR